MIKLGDDFNDEGSDDSVDKEDVDKEDTDESKEGAIKEGDKTDEDESKEESDDTSDESDDDSDEVKPPEPTERKYKFDGQELTPDELFEAAVGLKSEFTRKSQTLAKEQEPAENKRSELLKKYKQEDIEAFESLAKNLGFVHEKDLKEMEQKTTEKGVVMGFLKSHPEYNKISDPQGAKFERLNQELSKYNTSVDNLEWAMEKAHGDLTGDNKSLDAAKSAAKATRLRRSGVSSASNKTSTKTKPSEYNAEQIETMKKMGVWDED